MADELVYVDDEIVGEIVPVDREHRKDGLVVERHLPIWKKVRVPSYASRTPIPPVSYHASVPPGVSLTFYDLQDKMVTMYQNCTAEAQVLDLPSNAVKFAVVHAEPFFKNIEIAFEIAI